MALKSLVLLTLLVAAAAIVVPMAQAQLGGLLGPLLGLVKIQGVLYCTPNGDIGVNGTSTPVFSNALVELQCGGTVISTATTDLSGIFSILLDPISFVTSTLVSGCELVVNTPLATCNASLPSIGSLTSTLQQVGSSVLGLLNVANLIPTGFLFNAKLNQ